MCGCRLFIPADLRNHVLLKLHKPHQGITRTKERARITVYWPGIDHDIETAITACKECQDDLPSLCKAPMISHALPEQPFQHLAANFAELNGRNYLVMVDCFTDWPPFQLFSVLIQLHLNTICSHIQFTKEKVKSSLSFLDVLVSHANNVISTKIYKKPIHTDRYFQYSSHHSKQQKLAITHTLHHRIYSHITDPMGVQKARKDVCLILQTNGFPYKHTYPPKPKFLQDSPTFTRYTSLSYIQGTTKKIRSFK